MTKNSKKYRQLLQYLSSLGPHAVAFSGGIDSFFLLRASREAAQSQVSAITVVTPYMPERDVADARRLARELDVTHHIIMEGSLPELIRYNPRDRCYLCKRELFLSMLKELKQHQIDTLLDGTNADDIHEDRPGRKALEELAIKSPLMDFGITKAEIRGLLHDEGVHIAEKPSSSCLLTRLPYNSEVREKELERIDAAEEYMRSQGFSQVRVRSHGTLARIEVLPEERGRFSSPELCKQITDTFKSLGYNYITLDLEGYKTGTMDRGVQNG